jgi:hypothetical protein
MFLPGYAVTLTEDDRPWLVLGSTERRVTVPESVNFLDWHAGTGRGPGAAWSLIPGSCPRVPPSIC